jgi:hypothetical protein
MVAAWSTALGTYLPRIPHLLGLAERAECREVRGHSAGLEVGDTRLRPVETVLGS